MSAGPVVRATALTPTPSALASLVAWLNTIGDAAPEPDEVKSDDR